MAHKYWIKNSRFAFFVGAAGLFGITFGKSFHVHVLVKPSHWMLGHSIEEYDKSLHYFGLGPLVLVVWNN